MAVAALACLACAGPASAQSSFAVAIGDGAGIVRQLDAGAHVSGNVTVEFAGDPAAGCAAAGNCDVGGVISWAPGPSAMLEAWQYRQRGRLHTAGFVSFDSDSGNEVGTSSAAAVHRGGEACSDAGAETPFVELPEPVGRSLVFTLPSGSFDTRCPGPLPDDLADALPTATIPYASIRRGTRIDLGGARSFFSGGLRGTVRSTVALTVTKINNGQAASRRPPPLRRRRFRLMYATYRINQVAGTVPVDYTGVSDLDSCRPLDACGVAGTMTMAPRARSGTLTVSAIAPARRSRRDLRTALGLARGGRTRGIESQLVGAWSGDGTVSTEVARSGVPACHDSAALPGGLVTGSSHGRRISLSYAETPRTRCAGPLLTSVYETQDLASGRVSSRALGRPIAALRLGTGVTLADDGYEIRTRPALTIGIERLRVDESVFSDYWY